MEVIVPVPAAKAIEATLYLSEALSAPPAVDNAAPVSDGGIAPTVSVAAEIVIDCPEIPIVVDTAATAPVTVSP